MNIYSWIQLIFYMTVLLLLVKPLGSYMAKVYQREHVAFWTVCWVPLNDSFIASHELTRTPKWIGRFMPSRC